MSRPLVTFDDRSGCDLGDLSGEELARLMADVLDAEGASAGSQAGLHLVAEHEITALNEQHMAATGPTDVLSFPVDGVRAGPDVAPQPEAVAGATGQPTSLIGDVVLCPQVAAGQAASHAGNLADECRLLVVHGSLHLAGWDHDGTEARAAMWGREREVMAHLDVSPASDPWAQP